MSSGVFEEEEEALDLNFEAKDLDDSLPHLRATWFQSSE
jgi:hypothetical protein